MEIDKCDKSGFLGFFLFPESQLLKMYQHTTDEVAPELSPKRVDISQVDMATSEICLPAPNIM